MAKNDPRDAEDSDAMETRDVRLVLCRVQQLSAVPQNRETQQELAWQTWNICMEPVIFKPSNLCLADLEHLYGTSHMQTFKPLLGRPGTFVWNQSYSNLQTFAWHTWNIYMEPVIFTHIQTFKPLLGNVVCKCGEGGGAGLASYWIYC